MWNPITNSHTEELTLPPPPKGKGKSRKAGQAAQEPAQPNPQQKENVMRTLWLRTHPSAWPEVWQTVQDAASSTLHRMKQDRMGVEHATDEREDSIDLVDLRGKVNTFEIIGPLSSQVLAGALRVVEEELRQDLKQFWNSFKALQTPASLPRGMIIGFTVYDPRLNFPPKNTKAAYADNTSKASPWSLFPKAALAQSGIWAAVEKEGGVQRPRFKKKDLDSRRNENLVPGTPLRPLRQDDRVPVMLIQRTVAANLGGPSVRSRNDAADLMHGWTLLVPQHWSMPFFESLSYTGTRVGGLRERRTQVFEAGVPDFPFDYPHSPAYTREECVWERVERERWEAKPPAKRVAWQTVHTRSPWRADWEVVLGFPRRDEEGLLETQREEGAGNEEVLPSDTAAGTRSHSMWLLRGPDTAKMISDAALSGSPGATFPDALGNLRAKRGLTDPLPEAGALVKGALVQVRIDLHGRGAPDDLAAIYAFASAEDRSAAKTLLVASRSGAIEGAASEQLAALSIGAQDQDLIIGYITTGSYSLARGRGFAIGAASVNAVMDLLAIDHKSKDRSFPLMVRVKDRESALCRLASLEILS